MLHQNYGLFAFIPAKGATPNEDGIYGMFKSGGNFEDMCDADERAEEIVREYDSYNRIRMHRVGEPVILTVDPRYNLTDEEHCNEVDVNGQRTAPDVNTDPAVAASTAERLTREALQERRKADKKEMEAMREKEQNLQRDVNELADSPEEVYTTLRTKLANLTWTYIQTRAQQEKVQASIISTRAEIATSEAEDPTLADGLLDRFNRARERAGIPANDDSFIKYLVQDGAEELGF